MRNSQLIHNTYGVPQDVISVQEVDLGAVSDNELCLKMAYAPINPADLNMMEGRYFTQPQLPSQLGNEGVGVVVDCGAEVSGFSVGDHVIVPFKDKEHWLGSWTEHLIVPSQDCIKVPAHIDLKQAAMMSINPPTAYQLLHTTTLSKGDLIIQNAANSAVGRWVIYLAKELGFRTVNLVRRESLIDELKALGADHVYCDQVGVSQQIKKEVGKAALAINGVGGASALECTKTLAEKGTMVTYGAMSKAPVSIGNAALIYKDNKFCGFNRTRWSEEASRDEVRGVYERLFEILKKRPMTIPIEKIYPLNKAKDAIVHAFRAERGGKILLSF